VLPIQSYLQDWTQTLAVNGYSSTTHHALQEFGKAKCRTRPHRPTGSKSKLTQSNAVTVALTLSQRRGGFGGLVGSGAVFWRTARNFLPQNSSRMLKASNQLISKRHSFNHHLLADDKQSPVSTMLESVEDVSIRLHIHQQLVYLPLAPTQYRSRSLLGLVSDLVWINLPTWSQSAPATIN